METDSGNQQPDIADTSDLKNKEPKLKSAESIAEKTTIKRQKESDDKQSDTPEQSKNFIDFLNQIKKEQHNISMSLYKKFFFFYKTPDEMVRTLYNSKSKTDKNSNKFA